MHQMLKWLKAFHRLVFGSPERFLIFGLTPIISLLFWFWTGWIGIKHSNGIVGPLPDSHRIAFTALLTLLLIGGAVIHRLNEED